MAETFAELWMKYPRKVAKKAAEKAYQRALSASSHRAIEASLDTALSSEWKGRKPDYIPHMATWLNRESFEDRPQSVSVEYDRPLGRHLCDCCPVEHEWQEEGPAYNMCQNWILACPVAKSAVLGVKTKVSL